jgi:hypothetical protein
MYHRSGETQPGQCAAEWSEQKMTDSNCGSSALEDDVFVAEFERCRLPSDQFRHADHIRLAWIYVRSYEYDAAEARMRQSIQRFALHLGAEHKYHETITILWMRLANIAARLTPRIDTFPDFVRTHAWLLNKEIIFEFYSPELLKSDDARRAWVEPDLNTIPLMEVPIAITGS